MTNQVKEDESPAESTHIAYQVRQILFAQVMAQVHGERHIREGQRVAQRVGPDVSEQVRQSRDAG